MIFLLKYNEQIGLVTIRIITIMFLIVSYVMIYIPGNSGPFKPHAILRGPLHVESASSKETNTMKYVLRRSG